MRNYKWFGCIGAAMRRLPGSTYCFGIWRAAIGRPYNARQLLFMNSYMYE